MGATQVGTKWAVLVLILTFALAGCLAPEEGAWPTTVSPVDPELPMQLRPLLNASGEALALVPFLTVAGVTDPIAFGQAFADLDDPVLREFELAARYQQSQGNDRPGPFHTFGHPYFNEDVALVPEVALNRDAVELHVEIALPQRGLAPALFDHYPVILALEGLDGNTGMYRWWHAQFADAGYIVVAFDYAGQGKSEGSAPMDPSQRSAAALRDAEDMLEWLFSDGNSVRPFMDLDRIGVIGHSLGAITALSLQDREERIDAVVAAAPIHSSQNDFLTSPIPIMLQTGDHDGPIAPVPFLNPLAVRGVYDQLAGDRAIIVAEANSHDQHTNRPLAITPTWSRQIAAHYSVAWMDYYLKGEDDALDRVFQPLPRLSTLHGSYVEVGLNDIVLRQGELDFLPAV